ncbi:hypothetical protein N8590_01330 [bacterium]|nr:hypothetical protein [bacterium]
MAGHNLDPEYIVETVRVLRNRIHERFPDAGLLNVCEDLLSIAERARKRSVEIGRPMIGIRILSALIILTILGALGSVITLIRIPNQPMPAAEMIQVIDAAFGALVLIGATFIFLFTLEIRFKRSRALKAIHELRSLVHIIDMHQLTKDPERVLNRDSLQDTLSSPKRTMNRFQLNRYLDYCSEMLAFCGKIAALYVENFPDSQAVAAVNDLENLTTGLGRKIWQKIMILHSAPVELETVQQEVGSGDKTADPPKTNVDE